MMKTERKKILVSTYAGCSNKGAEALLRGLATILDETIGSERLELSMASIQPLVDKNEGLPFYEHFYQRLSRNISGVKGRILQYLTRICIKLHLEDRAFYYQHYDLLHAVKNQDIFVEMGADNYDVEYGEGYKWLYRCHEWIKKHTSVKMLLYDCSLNKNSITESFMAEVERFDATTIRESESFNNFMALYKGDKAYFCPDPAFVMPTEETTLPDVMKERDCVGINLSDLVLRDSYGVSKELAFDNYYTLIDYILQESEMGVVLIPHVMKNQDLSVLRQLYQRYTTNKRVALIENENLKASQLKYIISKFRFLVTARTHASIAAYSSYVPTLVLGYSVKSRGIAKDLFGDYTNYVFSIKDLTNSSDLKNSFIWILEHENEIRKKLEEVMPDYKERAKKVGYIIKEMLYGKDL